MIAMADCWFTSFTSFITEPKSFLTPCKFCNSLAPPSESTSTSSSTSHAKVSSSCLASCNLLSSILLITMAAKPLTNNLKKVLAASSDLSVFFDFDFEFPIFDVCLYSSVEQLVLSSYCVAYLRIIESLTLIDDSLSELLKDSFD